MFLNVNISETAKGNAKIRITAYLDFDICQRIIPLRKLHLINLTYFFKVENLKLKYLETEPVQPCYMTLSNILVL